MKQGVIGLAILAIGLYVVFNSYMWLGIALLVLGTGVLNGIRHDIWFSLEVGRGSDGDDGGDGGDGGGD